MIFYYYGSGIPNLLIEVFVVVFPGLLEKFNLLLG